jgi:preprotein translocase subunit SecA
MFTWIIKKIIGSKHQRTLRRILPVVAEINQFEQKLQSEPEEALRDRVAKWKDWMPVLQKLGKPFRD